MSMVIYFFDNKELVNADCLKIKFLILLIKNAWFPVNMFFG